MLFESSSKQSALLDDQLISEMTANKTLTEHLLEEVCKVHCTKMESTTTFKQIGL